MAIARSGSPVPALTAAQAGAACAEIGLLADDLVKLMEKMKAQGFGAFWPSWELISAYCKCESERELHVRCVIEGAKETLSRPFPPLRKTQASGLAVYRSELLAELRAQRDAELNSLGGDISQYPWLVTSDPCEQALMRLSLTGDRNYLSLEAASKSDRERCRHAELSRMAASDPRVVEEPFGQLEYLRDCLKEELGALGFAFDELKSAEDYPVFSKSMTACWDLCFAPEDPRSLVRRPFKGDVRLGLDVRPRLRRGAVDRWLSGEYLRIRYEWLIPRLKIAYSGFECFRELRLNVKAQVCAFGLISDRLEAGLKKSLPD